MTTFTTVSGCLTILRKTNLGLNKVRTQPKEKNDEKESSFSFLSVEEHTNPDLSRPYWRSFRFMNKISFK